MASQTLYGFRLDTVTVHYGNTRAPRGFANETIDRTSLNFLESLEDLRDDLVGHTRIGNLIYDPTLTPPKALPGGNSPAIRVESMSILANRVDFSVRLGRIGSHDLAIAEQASDDAPLDGKASTNPFYVSIYLPRAGSTGVVVSEVRSTTSAAGQLIKLISVLSYEQAVRAKDDSNTQWWRVISKPISDAQRLQEVLTQGKGAALQLKKKIAAPGKGRARTSVTLRRNGLPAGSLQAIQAIVFGWASIPFSSLTKAPAGSPVEQIAGLIGVNINTADFNEGSVTYHDAQGRTREIKPSNISEIFIYPVAEGLRPTTQEIRSKAEDRLRKLQSTLKIPLHI